MYLAANDKLVGYGTVVKGGGRYRFCPSGDKILCNIYIKEEERGKGYSNVLVNYMSRLYPTVYAFIRHNNTPSIKCFTNAGFQKICNAENKFKYILVENSNGHLGIYKKVNTDESKFSDNQQGHN